VGTLGGVEVAHHSRHGAGHARLSSQLDPRPAFAAFRSLGVNAVVATTVTGAVDRRLGLGSLVVFDDLYFPSNRLPDGALCTLFTDEGAADRGHWIFQRPFSSTVRSALLRGATEVREIIVDGGVYGHVDGPRLSSAPEIAAIAAAGVGAVSQTCGPETVLAGEAGLPFAVLGFVTDYANGVVDEPTPPELLGRMLAESGPAFAAVLAASAPALDTSHGAAGLVYRLG
ncbi:MAG: phosphorylase, partial [Thermoleophilia bacterium]|nr:phosphorylase [Thermoleophilia bacterium]